MITFTERKQTGYSFMTFCAIRYGPSNVFLPNIDHCRSCKVFESIWGEWASCFVAPFFTPIVHRFASVSRVTTEKPRLFWTYHKDKHRDREVPTKPGDRRNIAVTLIDMVDGPWSAKDSTNQYKIMLRKEMRLLIDTYCSILIIFDHVCRIRPIYQS